MDCSSIVALLKGFCPRLRLTSVAKRFVDANDERLYKFLFALLRCAPKLLPLCSACEDGLTLNFDFRSSIIFLYCVDYDVSLQYHLNLKKMYLVSTLITTEVTRKRLREYLMSRFGVDVYNIIDVYVPSPLDVYVSLDLDDVSGREEFYQKLIEYYKKSLLDELSVTICENDRCHVSEFAHDIEKILCENLLGEKAVRIACEFLDLGKEMLKYLRGNNSESSDGGTCQSDTERQD